MIFWSVNRKARMNAKDLKGIKWINECGDLIFWYNSIINKMGGSESSEVESKTSNPFYAFDSKKESELGQLLK